MVIKLVRVEIHSSKYPGLSLGKVQIMTTRQAGALRTYTWPICYSAMSYFGIIHRKFKFWFKVWECKMDVCKFSKGTVELYRFSLGCDVKDHCTYS